MQIRIATRASELALWQAEHVAGLLAEAGVGTEIVRVSTSGDRDKTTPLHVLGGKGVFVKEVQAAVLRGHADIAVHSAKDLPALTPDGLTIAAVPVRADAHDALIGCAPAALTARSRVATGSIRRRAQLGALVPGLRFAELRGNMATRIGRAGEFDAIVVAAAAIERLGLDVDHLHVLDTSLMIPQVGQGALAVECRSNDVGVVSALASIDNVTEHLRLECERGFLRELGGDCSLPAGAHATLNAGSMTVEGFLANEALTGQARASVAGDLGVAAETYGDDSHCMVDDLGRQLAREVRLAIDNLDTKVELP